MKYVFGDASVRKSDGSIVVDAALLARFGLTEKERQIIPLILEGELNKQLARILGISVKSVNNHLYGMYRQIGINSRFELIRLISVSRKNNG